MRHLDVGADGYIDNTPIPGFTSDNMTRLKAPRMDFSKVIGFKMDVVVNTGTSYAGRAKRVLGLNRQVRLTDHPRLMQIIKQECIKKGYKVFD